jgi:hypothetical protein
MVRGLIFFEFAGGRIGHMVFFSQADEVKVPHEEGGEQFSAGPVEVFPQQFGRFRDRGIIVWLTDPLFSTLLTMTVPPSGPRSRVFPVRLSLNIAYFRLLRQPGAG